METILSRTTGIIGQIPVKLRFGTLVGSWALQWAGTLKYGSGEFRRRLVKGPPIVGREDERRGLCG